MIMVRQVSESNDCLNTLHIEQEWFGQVGPIYIGPNRPDHYHPARWSGNPTMAGPLPDHPDDPTIAGSGSPGSGFCMTDAGPLRTLRCPRPYTGVFLWAWKYSANRRSP